LDNKAPLMYARTFKARYDRCMEFLLGLVRDLKEGNTVEEKIKTFWEDENKTWLILSSEFEEKNKKGKPVIGEAFYDKIIGKSKQMKEIFNLIESVAISDTPVLITGESGTGKELIARTIHSLSHRKERPFVEANCSAYAEPLLESELFGHEKGAFTDAIRTKKGRFELADGGTIFLDEIGEIPPKKQLLLLRVLKEKKFERVGGAETLEVDVRVISATKQDLRALMMDGQFREDLYYLIRVIPVTVPPLRSRREDIPLLAHHFLEIYSINSGKWIRGYSEEVMQIFMDYDWPGNVQELQNAIEHAAVLAKGRTIEVIDLPHNLKEALPKGEAEIPSLNEVERNLIVKALREANGNKYRAAKKLGITRSTLYGKIKKHGITG
jgi:transcriptional regulator with GAF, ATPase, and Fis domain